MRLNSSLLPRPRLSLFLLIIWLFLNDSVSPATLIFGALLAWLIPLLTRAFWPEEGRIRHPLLFGRYVLRVLFDIVVANFAVARLVLGPAGRLRPGFVTYPLTLEHDFAITVLASTISLTPGTVTVNISADRKHLLIHGLDVENEEELIADIRARYEMPLTKVFQ